MKGVETWDQQVVLEKYYRDVKNPTGNFIVGPEAKPLGVTKKWPSMRNKKHRLF